MLSAICAALVIFSCSVLVDGLAFLKLKPETFQSSVKCDTFSKCDYKFKFCVDEIGHSSVTCRYKFIETGIMGAAPVYFSESYAINISYWPGAYLLKVDVYDHDNFDSDDYITTVTGTVFIGTANTPYWHSSSLSSNKGTLTLKSRVSCAQDHYGYGCDVYCKSNNSTFRCNSMTGAKICYTGWTGHLCDFAETTTTLLTENTTLSGSIETTESVSVPSTAAAARTAPTVSAATFGTTTSERASSHSYYWYGGGNNATSKLPSHSTIVSFWQPDAVLSESPKRDDDEETATTQLRETFQNGTNDTLQFRRTMESWKVENATFNVTDQANIAENQKQALQGAVLWTVMISVLLFAVTIGLLVWRLLWRRQRSEAGCCTKGVSGYFEEMRTSTEAESQYEQIFPRDPSYVYNPTVTSANPVYLQDPSTSK